MTEFISKLWQASRPMTAVGLALFPLFVASVAGIFLDPRTITGAPAWLKPAKFALSISIYLLTLSWVYSYLTIWQPLLSAIGWISAVLMVVEIVIIDLQAFRGTTSHFNIGTSTDAMLFGTMGAAIAVAWVGSAVIAAAVFVQHFDNPVFAAALRCGIVLTVLGSASGALMPGPTKIQLADAEKTGKLMLTGAHTVGAPDGGPGLPLTGWSTLFGDLRIPHFLGMHGLQIIPLLAWLLILWQVPESKALMRVYVASASYLALFGILLWQAMRAEPFSKPSSTTWTSLALWAVLTTIAWFL